MKKILSILLSVMLLSGFLSLFANKTVYAVTTVEIWERTDIVLNSTKSYTNPYFEVSIDAVFTHTDGTTIAIPGFWNGNNEWRVRFSPTKTGTWTYVITCTDTSNTGLHNQTGTINAVPNTGNTEIDKKGFVKLTQGNRYFTYNDDTPFYWLGDTNWQAPNYVSITQCNYPGCTGHPLGQFQHEVDNRIAKGFTVYQTYFDGSETDGGGQRAVGGQPSYWRNKYSIINPDTFTNKFDKMIDYLASNGMVIALGIGLTTPTPTAMGETEMLNYAKYITARYASYPIIWILGQEITIDISGTAYAYNIWKKAGAHIDKYDGYKHPQGAHMIPTYYDTVKDLDAQPWHEWWTLQAGHGGVATSSAIYKSFYDNSTKPYIETEANYEDIYCGGFTGYDANRISAWKANQCGSVGFTYGATGIWANCYSTAGNTGWLGSYSTEPWYMGLDKPGSFEMTYLKRFYTYVDFSTLIPRFNDQSYCNFTGEKKVLSVTSDKSTYVAYFYNSDKLTGLLKGLNAAQTYSARWYNTRTGKFIDISNQIVVANGTYTIPNKPDSKDWALLVTSKNLGTYQTESLTTYSNEDGRTNLVLGKTASASTENGVNFLASKATDGSYSTYWCATSSAMPQWFEVDMGSTQNIKELQMYCYNTSRSYEYNLEGSLDGSSWFPILSRAGQTPIIVEGLDYLSAQFDATCRYLRLNFTAIDGNWATLYEFKVFNALNNISITGTKQTPVSVSCIGSGIYDALQHYINTDQYLADNDISTEWHPFASIATQSVYFDLGVPKALSYIAITPGSGAELPCFRVEGSNDKSNWAIIADSSLQAPDKTTLPGQSVQALCAKLSGSYQYVKLIMLNAGNNTVNKNISEVGIYATATLNVSSASGYRGKTVTVNIDISDAKNLSAAGFELSFDETKLQCLSAEAGSAFSAGMTDINITPSKILISYIDTAGLAEGGTIVTATFRLKDNLTSQVTPITLSILEALDLDEASIPFNITQGSITINDYMLGDVNKSGTISSMDALLALQVSTGKLAATEYTFLTADVNFSGSITSFDALKILRFSTGKIMAF